MNLHPMYIIHRKRGNTELLWNFPRCGRSAEHGHRHRGTEYSKAKAQAQDRPTGNPLQLQRDGSSEEEVPKSHDRRKGDLKR